MDELSREARVALRRLLEKRERELLGELAQLGPTAEADPLKRKKRTTLGAILARVQHQLFKLGQGSFPFNW